MEMYPDPRPGTSGCLPPIPPDNIYSSVVLNAHSSLFVQYLSRKRLFTRLDFSTSSKSPLEATTLAIMPFNLGKLMSRSRSSDTVSTAPEAGIHHTEHSHAEHHAKAPLPFFASPVDPEALKWLERRKRASTGLAKSGSVDQFESDTKITESRLANRIFRKQHEASSLELFFDLFFVGNLAVFTTKSAHVDLQCK